MKDSKRYSEAFKLKVMEELRDGKWKTVADAATAYGIAEMSVYNWMHKLGIEHLKGSLIYVKTRTEADRINELEAEVKKLRLRLALVDEVLDHKIDEAALRAPCSQRFTPESGSNRYKAMHEKPENSPADCCGGYRRFRLSDKRLSEPEGNAWTLVARFWRDQCADLLQLDIVADIIQNKLHHKLAIIDKMDAVTLQMQV